MTPASAKQHIVLLITNLGLGGAQRAFAEQARALKDRFQVTEVVFNSKEAADIYNTGNAQHSLNITAGRNFFDKLVKLYKRAAGLKAFINQSNSVLCISHMDGANWVNILSRSRAKKILVVHGTVLHDFSTSGRVQYTRKNLIIPSLYKKAHCVVAVSEGIKKELETACGLKNVVAIPNAFDIAQITQSSVAALPAGWEALFATYDILITSGRLHEQKQQRFLLPLFKKIKAHHGAAKLVIMGDGPLREALLKEAAALGLRCYTVWHNDATVTDAYDVYFPGYVANPFQYLHRSRIFLFPSAWEGFPLALCEAMIAGVPVLAADCPTGPREILAPGTFDIQYQLQTSEETAFGYLLPTTSKPQFETAWYEAICTLLNHPEKRSAFIANAQNRMQAYNQPIVLKKWLDVIDGVLAAP